jgi:signal transduction histidine kinase/ligand-binding sensor domain-containing protein
LSSYTEESGLPSNQVVCIAETRKGTIWVGTQKGLAWFDNHEWHLIDTAKGLPPRQVHFIEEFGEDAILVCVDSSLYIGDVNGFKSLITPEIIGKRVIQSAVMTTGDGFLVLIDRVLYEYTQRALKPVPMPASPIPTGGGRNLWRTASGALWLNTERGLYRGDGKTWRRVLPSSPLACIISTITEDNQGNGLAAVDLPIEVRGVWEWSRFGRPRISSTERSRFPLTMDMGPDGSVLVVYQSGDVRIRSKEVWSSVTAPTLAFASIRVVKYLRDGRLLVGTNEGLSLYNLPSKRWEYWRYPFGDLRNYAHSICRISDGSIWIGTLDGIEIHKPDGRVAHLGEILGTPLGTVTSVAEDRMHHIWVGSGASFEGAFRWDGRSWRHFGPVDGLRADRIHKIRLDRKGRPWFLGLAKDYSGPLQPGAFLYDQGKFISVPVRDTMKPDRDGLVNGRVYCFAEGKDGAYWFGTLRGISRLKGNLWTHWTGDDAFKNLNDRIYALAIDSSGMVYFSNEVSGLGYINSLDQVHFITTDSGLVNNSIWDLNADENGGLWISTRGGLSYLRDGAFFNFTLRNGLNSLSLWDVLPFKDRIYIGTTGSGVNVLRRTEDFHPPLLRFKDRSFRGATALVRWQAFPFVGEMQPEDITYRHRVDAGEWSNWRKESEVTLTNLAPGEHTMEVQTRGIFGITHDAQSVSILIEPPIYRRPEVIIPIGLLAITLTFLGGAYWRRESKHRRQLEQSDERFHLLASSTSDVIVDWNFAAEAVWANDPKQALVATPSPKPEEVLKSWLQKVHPDDRARVRRSFLTAIVQKATTWNQEYRYLKDDETFVHILNRFQILYSETGGPIRLIGSGIDISDRKNAEEMTRDLTRRILEAQEGERRRVSRELHDSVSQILASVKFRIESLEEQLAGRSPRFKREAKRTKELLNKVMTEVRRISRNLRPAELDDLGLASAVRSLAEEFTERSGIGITLPEPWPRHDLPPEITETLYRIIQEALTNVEKHSNAKRVAVSFTTTPDYVACSISDNGRGMQRDERGKTRSKGGGLGIVDMRERLSFLKGTLEISPRGKRGTTLTVRIPLQAQPTSQQPSQSKHT